MIIKLEEKGLVMDWTATGKQITLCLVVQILIIPL